jgi:rhodanese-related sulfurtransferase
MITEITSEELGQKIAHPQGSVLLEVLPPEEYRQSHFPGALNVPPAEVQKLAPELVPNKGTEIIVCCSDPACHESEMVAQQLAAMGYSHVRHYSGGKSDWHQMGLPLSKEPPRRAA